MNEVTEKYIREHVVHCEKEDDIRDVADALAMVAKQTPPAVKEQIGLNDDTIRFASILYLKELHGVRLRKAV